MTEPHDFARIESWFAEVATLDRADRDAVLDAACADRPDLRLEIDALLESHDRLSLQPGGDPVWAEDADVGSMAGPFRLIARIGAGGMGTVFRAERADGAFTQAVAVKIMRSALVDPDLRHRFRVERQILASLRHPNIVTLLDGGALPDGRAYLVMELVEGAEIIAHCRALRLPLAERLRLFQTLCAAVQYAHQHGVVHRDLKPANVLIAADGTLKVLDFGVAKLLGTPAMDAAVTQGILPGPLTPNYASPEQLRGLPITTASDVYTLGILLYELAADVRPYEVRGLPLDELIETVTRRAPAKPSVHAGAGHLRGDIDAIVFKAIAKEPSERYASAGELGGDVARHLAGEPVLARGPSAAYVLRRLAARNRTVVTVTALALAGMVATSAVALWQRQVAKREQARAEQRFHEVRQLANALIFKVHDAVAPLAGSTPVRRTIVEQAVTYLENLEREAGAEDVTLRLELAAAYRQIAAILGDPQRANLGDRDGAIRQYEKARAIVLPLSTETAPYEVILALSRIDGPLTTLYNLRNDRERSAGIAREAVARAERYRRRHPTDLRGLETLASSSFHVAWTASAEERLALWRRALVHYDELLTARPESVETQRNVALVEKYLGELLPPSEAEPHFRRAVELDDRRLRAQPDHRQTQLDTAISIAGLARSLEQQGRREETLLLLERSLAVRRALADSDPKDVRAQALLGSVLSDLARVKQSLGQREGARTNAADAVRTLEAVAQQSGDRWVDERLAYALVIHGMTLPANDGTACRGYRRAHDLFTRAGNSADAAADAAQRAAACR